MVERNFMMSSCFVHSLLEAQHPKSKNFAKSQRQKLDGKDSPPIDGFAEEFDKDADPSSRMLTKRQLSEMALGVRELSKHLGMAIFSLSITAIVDLGIGNVQMKLPSKRLKLLVVTKIHDNAIIIRTRELVEWILSKYSTHIM